MCAHAAIVTAEVSGLRIAPEAVRPVKAPPITVAEAAEQWLAFYVPCARSAKNAMMAVQRVRDYVEPFMGARAVVQLQPDDIRAHRLWLQEQGLAPRTVRHLMADVRCFLNWTVEADIIARSPFPKRVMPRIQETPPDRLTDTEVEALLAVDEPHAFVMRLALGTGLRWAELCRAQASHLEGGMLVVYQTKSSRMRRVPVADTLREEIRGRVGRLCSFTIGAPSSFAKVVRNRSGIRRFHVHQLRHTFACRWIEAGGSLPALQQILGHASIVTTQHYARLSDEHVRSEAARINGAKAVWRVPGAQGPEARSS